MNSSCDKLLPGPRLSQNKYVEIGSGNSRHLLAQAEAVIAAADQLATPRHDSRRFARLDQPQ